MRIQHIKPILAKRYMNPKTRKRSVYLRGKSGVGKSDAIKQLSQFLSEHVKDWRGVIDLRLAQCDPTDLRGIPTVVDGRTSHPRIIFLPQTQVGSLA